MWVFADSNLYSVRWLKEWNSINNQLIEFKGNSVYTNLKKKQAYRKGTKFWGGLIFAFFEDNRNPANINTV